MTRARSIAFLGVAFALSACNAERKKQHEALGESLRAPVSLLCQEVPKEGGGCYRDCQTWNAAERGVAVVSASEPIARLPAFADPETEARLVVLRASAANVNAALRSRCAIEIERGPTIPPEVRACADEVRARGNEVSAFVEGLENLSVATKKRTGVFLPKPWKPCFKEDEE